MDGQMSINAQETVTETRMTGAEMIVQALVDQGIDTIFGYPGGAVLPIYDALFKQDKVKHILVRHEQAAVHAAEGYARSTGKVGAVLVTSGPGATNAVTGLTDAMLDSIPLICLTGQVPSHLIGTDAFQEADITGITRSCTKHNYLVKDVAQLSETIHEAFYVAKSGRPGPVVIDLPKDVQFDEGLYKGPSGIGHKTYRPKTIPDSSAIDQALDLISQAQKPIFYVGGGVINAGAGACQQLTDFIQELGFPITATLMGLGAYPTTDKQFLGMLGMHGTYEANLAMHDCDLMINIGARFDDRVTGKVSEFSPNSTKIHVDIDPSSINKIITVDLPVIGDAGSVISALAEGWKKKQLEAQNIEAWWQKISDWRAVRCLSYQKKDGVIKPQQALERLRDLTKGKDPYITTEVGQHQMWAAQFFPFEKPNRWMTSGGLGTMGYGLPAAIGTQVADMGRLVIDVAGEASTMMNIQEIATAVQYRLPIKVFILNNKWMGMVRQWQELLHGSRYSESYSEALPDFVKLAEAFGATGLRAETPDQLDAVITQMLATDGPVIADICVDETENCFPMIPGGAPHNQMILGETDGAHQKATSDEGKKLV